MKDNRNKDKKIGIMTFHASHNSGSMLQTVALQKVLEDRGLQVEVIDFSNEAQQNMYSPLPKATNYRKFIKNIIWASNYRQLKKQYNQYEVFKNKYMKLSPNKYSTAKELENIESDYDYIVAGSDQVWNTKCTDADDAYYLNFVNKKTKLAYAVSFGANNPFILDDKREVYKEYLKEFSSISVREKNARKWIKEGTQMEVPICLDPTMLLNKEEWEQTVDVGRESVIKGDYIFYYCFSISFEIAKFLKWVSKKYNMPVYFMEAKEWTLKMCWLNDIKLIKEYGPDVFMNVMKHAKIIITTSFHGTAFSTIYRKNFWYIDDGNNNPERDDRALSFLNQLGLMERYKKIEELKQQNLLEGIDYSDTEEKLVQLQKESFSYIDSMIESE